MIEMLVFIAAVTIIFGLGMSALQRENRELRQKVAELEYEYNTRLTDLEGTGSLGRLRVDLREKARREVEARKSARPRIVRWMIENLA